MVEGKIHINELGNLLSYVGYNNKGIIFGPQIGLDASVVNFNLITKETFTFYEIGSNEEIQIVIKSDPITFETSNPSKYGIIVNMNDLSCMGALPFGITATFLLPTSSSERELLKLQKELDKVCRQNKLSILGGHTEYTSSVNRIVLSISMIGFVPNNYLPTRKIKPGDKIFLLGLVANEGTAILLNELKKRKKNVLKKSINRSDIEFFEDLLSIKEDALILNKKYKLLMMHDPTEGGVLGALYEMFITTNCGILIEKSKLYKHLHPLTEEICNTLDINPYRLISSGTLLFVLDKVLSIESTILNKLKHSMIQIGEVTEVNEILMDDIKINPPDADELIKGIEKINSL